MTGAPNTVCISCFFIFFILRVGKQAFQSLISRGISFLEQVSPWLPETRFPDFDSRQLDGDFAPHTLKHNQ